MEGEREKEREREEDGINGEDKRIPGVIGRGVSNERATETGKIQRSEANGDEKIRDSERMRFITS